MVLKTKKNLVVLRCTIKMHCEVKTVQQFDVMMAHAMQSMILAWRSHSNAVRDLYIKVKVVCLQCPVQFVSRGTTS